MRSYNDTLIITITDYRSIQIFSFWEPFEGGKYVTVADVTITVNLCITFLLFLASAVKCICSSFCCNGVDPIWHVCAMRRGVCPVPPWEIFLEEGGKIQVFRLLASFSGLFVCSWERAWRALQPTIHLPSLSVCSFWLHIDSISFLSWLLTLCHHPQSEGCWLN